MLDTINDKHKGICLADSYGTAQLQGNEHTRVIHEKLACILQSHARVLTCWGLVRIKISARFQLITM